MVIPIFSYPVVLSRHPLLYEMLMHAGKSVSPCYSAGGGRGRELTIVSLASTTVWLESVEAE